jgi:hypothetical protein
VACRTLYRQLSIHSSKLATQSLSLRLFSIDARLKRGSLLRHNAVGRYRGPET